MVGNYIGILLVYLFAVYIQAIVKRIDIITIGIAQQVS